MVKEFIKLDYTGKTKDGSVFDTTKEDVAKENNLYNPEVKYEPVVICPGEGHLIKGVEDYIKDKEEGHYTIELSPEDAFGQRDSKKLQLIPTKKLKDNQINPFPGLKLNVDGGIATVKSVSGGRTVVDFNHPMAGQEVTYEVDVLGKVTDPVEITKAVLKREANLTPEIEKKDDQIIIKNLNQEQQEAVKSRLSEFIDNKIVFKEEKNT